MQLGICPTQIKDRCVTWTITQYNFCKHLSHALYNISISEQPLYYQIQTVAVIYTIRLFVLYIQKSINKK